MEFTANESTQYAEGRWKGLFSGHDLPRSIIAAVVLAIALAAVTSWLNTGNEPPRLREGIPFVTNTLQYLADNRKFMDKATSALKKRNLAKFYLAGIPVYLISGVQNMQTLFGRGDKVGSEDIFVQKVLPRLYKMPPHHVARFANDKSGRGKVAAAGHEDTPPEQRYWAQYEHVHTEFLFRTQHLKPVIDVFSRHLSEIVERFPVGQSRNISVMKFCRREIAEVAMRTLLGPAVFKLNPGFLDAFWEFDDNVFMLTLGFPKWLYARPYRVHDRYLDMIKKYVDSAFEEFDWNGPDAEAAWEPHFGARVCREISKWLRDGGFLDMSIAGALGTLLFAQNSNTIPTAMWMILELAHDPTLFQAIRAEVAPCWTTDPSTGIRALDTQKVSTSPLLQSILAETLRLRTNFNIIRQVKEPLAIDGHTLPRGAMLQAPMMVAHYDEAVWAAGGHPAAEFWAERHVKYVDEVDAEGRVVGRKRQFAMAGRPSSYFPFGGGAPICPGRHFAKHEIMVMVAHIVSRFDIERVEWKCLDGSPSDRPAQNDQRFCGAGGMPPDRDLDITWKRLW